MSSSRTIPASASVGALIYFTIATDEADAARILASHTHTCGYTYAWPVVSQPLSIWYLWNCPADAAIAATQSQLVGLVTARYLGTTDIPDPTDRAEAIVNLVTSDISAWITATYYDHLAGFLQAHPNLRWWIELE